MPSFVDTNVLVYAEDLDAGFKHERARDLVVDLWNSGDGILSVQVLQEFFVTTTRKLRNPLAVTKAIQIVDQYLSWTIVENTKRLLQNGIKLSVVSKISFWDALVVQAALETECDLLYSEDLGHGRRFGKLRVVNPFAEQP